MANRRDELSKIGSIRKELREKSKFATVLLDYLAPKMFTLLGDECSGKRKFTDPVWKTITVNKYEAQLIDTPLMQRLRRVRQLGLAHLVYPTAVHTRFDHSLGVLQAAERMFAALAEGASSDQQDELRKSVRFAALVHDCGHTAFSHVGEEALNDIECLREEFIVIKDVFSFFFKDEVRERINRELENKAFVSMVGCHRPAVAELVSAVLISSEALEKNLTHFGIDKNIQLRAVASILGFPINDNGSKNDPDYIKSIISGDLDADKIDYVARDAYFSGIPIAADVDRLLSQLTPVEYRPKDHKKMLLFGVLPSGIPAVEMFILTRAYLFGRIYQHPKIRLAEHKLRIRLHHYIEKLINDCHNDAGGAYTKIIDLLYGHNGDDGCLEQLDHLSGKENALANTLRSGRKALALAQRHVVGFDLSRGEAFPSLKAAWTAAGQELRQEPLRTAKEMAAIVDLEENNIVLDWHKAPHIKEQPNIYISCGDAARLRPIWQAIDIGQLAQAYESVKGISWIFADGCTQETVAAGAAIRLFQSYGIVPLEDALINAKIDIHKFTEELDKLSEKYKGKFEEIAVSEIKRAIGGGLTMPYIMLKHALHLKDDDALASCMHLSEQIAESGLGKNHETDVMVALQVAAGFLSIIRAEAEKGSSHNRNFDEKEFQDWTIERMRSHFDREMRPANIDREKTTEAGRIDLDVTLLGRSTKSVAIEIKSEERPFEEMIKLHVGQAFDYLANEKFGRVGILWCQFKSENPWRPGDALEIVYSNEGSACAVLCIGIRNPGSPSSARKPPKKVTPPTTPPRAGRTAG